MTVLEQPDENEFSSSDSSLGVPHKRAPPALCQTYPTFSETESCCNNYFYEK